MQTIKNLVLKFFNKIRPDYPVLVYRYHRKYKSILKTFIFGVKSFFLFYTPSGKLIKGNQVLKLFRRVKININQDNRFVYNIDIYKTMHRNDRMIDNISIDYSRVLNESLSDMKKRIKKLNKDDELLTINAIDEFIDKECVAINKSDRSDKEKIIRYLKNIKKSYPKSFEEAIQRILFFNQLFWQSGHGLIGLGELDFLQLTRVE